MIQTLKNNFAILLAGIVLAFASVTATLVLPAITHADQVSTGVCTGASTLQVTSDPSVQCSSLSSDSNTGVNALITKIINVFSVVVGVVAVVMIIVGGFRYITSGGDSNNVGAAKNTILYAIVGLIIVALAQVIVRFVLGSASNAVT